jgi:intracellular septation protein
MTSAPDPQPSPEGPSGLPEGNGEERPGAKLLIELGPLLVFLLTLVLYGIVAATAVLMGATLVSLVASRLVLGRIAPMLYVTAVTVWGFGGLTLLYNDGVFIKLKLTIVNLAFAAALGIGLIKGKLFLKLMLGEAFSMTELGWRLLTYRWIGFFVVMALLNEAIRLTTADTTWGAWKTGSLFITIAFAVAQVGLMKRHQLKSTH